MLDQYQYIGGTLPIALLGEERLNKIYWILKKCLQHQCTLLHWCKMSSSTSVCVDNKIQVNVSGTLPIHSAGESGNVNMFLYKMAAKLKGTAREGCT